MRISRRQLRRIIKEELEGGTVELTTPGHSRNEVFDAWPNGVTYAGKRVFDIFYANQSVVNSALNNLRREGYDDGQEVYLGYSPRQDVFVMGFAAFEEGADFMDGVSLEMESGGSVMDMLEATPGGMYPSGLAAVKQFYPDIIDVRLD